MVQTLEKHEETESFEHEEQELDIEEEENTPKSKKITTTKAKIRFKDTDNSILADLQQRLIALEYEFMMIRDKLFTPSRATGEQKLNSYGKEVKRRLRSTL